MGDPGHPESPVTEHGDLLFVVLPTAVFPALFFLAWMMREPGLYLGGDAEQREMVLFDGQTVTFQAGEGVVDEIDSGTVIIRSHGVTMKEFKDANDKGLNVLDATCPFVTRVQSLVAKLVKEDYYVVIVGENDHPEVKGVLSYAEGYKNICVALDIKELKDIPPQEKIGVVAQTTLSIEQLKDVTSYLLELGNEVKVFNTICDATSVRQGESKEVAAKVDTMIVVGGRNSANTNRLLEICSEIQPKSFHIEVADEIDPKWFENSKKIGVTAGASTPDWIIAEVVNKIES